MPWWWPLGKVPEVEAHELNNRLEKGEPIQLMDVRTRTEYDYGHIAGAINAPIASLKHRLDSLGLDPTRPVVTICKTAHRSIPATRLLRQRDFEAAQLAKGMDQWRQERLSVEK